MNPIDWNSMANQISESIWSTAKTIDLSNELPILLDSLGHSIESRDVIDQFDRFKGRVVRILVRKITECNEAGITPRLVHSSVDADRFISKSSSSMHHTREQIKHTLKLVSSREFEQLSVFILQLNGVIRCHTMRGTKEEGIDIFGELDLGNITASAIWHSVPIRILGQAKMGKISEPQVRLFNQDLQSFFKGEGRAFGQAPAWFRKLPSPLVGFMLTADSFTGGADTWGKNHGISLKDSRQLVEDLIKHHNQVPGITLNGDTASFNADTFLQFVKHLDFKPVK